MKSVVFVGQAYYNAYLLNLELRKKGYDTLLINIDPHHVQNAKYYWGEDMLLPTDLIEKLELYLTCIHRFKFFHFANRGGIYFLNYNTAGVGYFQRKIRYQLFKFFSSVLKVCSSVDNSFFMRLLNQLRIIEIQNNEVKIKLSNRLILRILNFCIKGLPSNWDIYLLKALGKKIIYANNGCHDGVGPTSFSKWGPSNVCDLCPLYKTEGCTDEKAFAWGEYRNSVIDYQILLGGNKADYNLAPNSHEVPEFYCLDEELWTPQPIIPEKYRLNLADDVIKIYHSVGNYDSRTRNGVNIKCSHIYFPLIDELKAEGYKVEIVFCKDIPNIDVRYVMQQCDIAVDMLTYGFFGANLRESMMLGIPSVCFLRREWMDDASKEIPEYVKELPIVNANPETIKSVLIELIQNKKLRAEIGKKSREFAIKWHSKKVGAERMEKIYQELVSF